MFDVIHLCYTVIGVIIAKRTPNVATNFINILANLIIPNFSVIDNKLFPA
jgi:hypothetical protein